MTPDCLKWSEQMPAARRLSRPEREALMRHIEECPDCRRVYQEFSQMEILFCEYDYPAIPPGFAENILHRLEAETGAESETARRQAGTALLAAGILVGVEIFWFLWAPAPFSALGTLVARYAELAMRWLGSAPATLAARLAGGLPQALAAANPFALGWPVWTVWVAAGAFLAAAAVAKTRRDIP